MAAVREHSSGGVSRPGMTFARRRHQLAQQLEALGVELSAKNHYPGDVGAGMRQTIGEALLYQIRSADNDDRQRPRLSTHRQRIGNSGSDDDIRICRDQLGGGEFAPLGVLAGYPALDGQIMSLDPAEAPHRLVEPVAGKRFSSDDEPDARALRCFLGAGPPSGHSHRRAAYQVAPSHAVTPVPGLRCPSSTTCECGGSEIRLFISSPRRRPGSIHASIPAFAGMTERSAST